MTHEFSHNPIKLRIVDLLNGSWKQTYTYVGTVPKDVERELHKLEHNPSMPTNKILKQFYGIGWQTKLGTVAFSSKKKKIGGTELSDLINSDEILADNEIDNEILVNTDRIPSTTELIPLKEHASNILSLKENDIEILGGIDFEVDDQMLLDLDDISLTTGLVNPEKIDDSSKPDIDQPEESIEELITLDDLSPQPDFLTEKESTLEVSHAGGIKFITDTYITPADNILEFKLKIYTSIGIPIYRQHLWFKYRDRSYPMQYMTSLHKHVESIDIEKLIMFYKDPTNIKGLDNVNGIPIEINYYNNKDFLHVSARDTFDLLRNIYYKYATNEFFIVDLNDLIKPSDLYAKLNQDKYQLDLIYFGFIIIYFPSFAPPCKS